MPAAIVDAVRLAERLALAPGDVPARLRRIVTSDDAGRAMRLRALGALADTAPPADLLALLARLSALVDHAGPDTAWALARALGEISDPASEPALLSVLKNRQEPIAAAAARALGRIGDLTTAERLLAYADGEKVSEPLKKAARDAAAQIRARLGAAQAGALSVAADGEPGRLSLVDGAGRDGGLSLAPQSGPDTPPGPASPDQAVTSKRHREP